MVTAEMLQRSPSKLPLLMLHLKCMVCILTTRPAGLNKTPPTSHCCYFKQILQVPVLAKTESDLSICSKYFQHRTPVSTAVLFLQVKQRYAPSCGDRGAAGLLLVLSLSCSDGALFRRGAGSGPLADELPAGASAESSEKQKQFIDFQIKYMN